MAEVQKTTESGEMTQRFIEFVMMQAQNAAHFLGQIPGPNGPAEVNLDLAKLFIDQLVMIRAKTLGNLGNDEQSVLNNAISNLQMAFVEVSQGNGPSLGSDIGDASLNEPARAPSAPQAEQSALAAEEPAAAESRKKFSKSYGA